MIKQLSSKIAKEYLQGMIDSFNDDCIPGVSINGAFVKSLYVDRDDCEVFNFAIQAIEKLEKIEEGKNT